MRLVAPFAGGAFAKIARDAREGMQATLDALADAKDGSGSAEGKDVAR